MSEPDMTWENPPPKFRDTQSQQRRTFTEALKRKPGEWAYYGAGYNSGTVSNFRRAEPGTEWTARKQSDGTYKVWGRWVGDE